MTATNAKPHYAINIDAPANGRLHKSTITVEVTDGKPKLSDKADLADARELQKAAGRLAEKLKKRGIDDDAEAVAAKLEQAWDDVLTQNRRQRKQAEAGSPDAAAVMTIELLDAQPDVIRRPLCLIGGHAYAAAWGQVRTTTARSVDDAGKVTEHNPPLVVVEDRLVIVRDDGQSFANGPVVPGSRPIAELGLPVCLAESVPARCGWSGAGVKGYLNGSRPQPTKVFGRVVSVVDRFLDFSRSLADQKTMSEMVACYILATYFLDAFPVIGYLWPNGEAGSGKTTLLQVVSETAYLGHLILAGSSYPTLRDLANYGATLAFDDAEAVMDVRRTDPDKRTLLLAGNRPGSTIAVKESLGDRWVTRQVSTYCPRLFSAIRLPDPTLGSRCIIVPLVRSGDSSRAKSTPMDPTCWPCDRRQLIDDLWALGLTNLPALVAHDRQAASRAELMGRSLEPWRAILSVSHWLEREGIADLFQRMANLSVAYQQERGDYEENDQARVLFRALLGLTCGKDVIELAPGAIAKRMNAIAEAEDLAEPEKPFTSAKRVGWLMKRQRFERAHRGERCRPWRLIRSEVETAAQAYGVQIPAKAEQPEEPEDPGPSPFG